MMIETSLVYCLAHFTVRHADQNRAHLISFFKRAWARLHP